MANAGQKVRRPSHRSHQTNGRDKPRDAPPDSPHSPSTEVTAAEIKNCGHARNARSHADHARIPSFILNLQSQYYWLESGFRRGCSSGLFFSLTLTLSSPRKDAHHREISGQADNYYPGPRERDIALEQSEKINPTRSRVARWRRATGAIVKRGTRTESSEHRARTRSDERFSRLTTEPNELSLNGERCAPTRDIRRSGQLLSRPRFHARKRSVHKKKSKGIRQAGTAR
jgi:hypothetical protein